MNPDYVSLDAEDMQLAQVAFHDGGPAFPLASPEMVLTGQSVKNTQGMSLRDYFAAKAMQGDWAAQSLEIGIIAENSTDDDLKRMATLYYRMADQMLIARNK